MLDIEGSSISNKRIIPVILSGGVGTRLWPLSKASYPKQYLSLPKERDKSLLQKTYLRLKGLKNLDSPIIICNEEQRFITAEQIRLLNIEPKSILLEPFGKNTAPAVALASLIALEEENYEPILLVLPSDHLIKDKLKFNQTISEAIPFAEKGKIVVFGVSPTSPETGYGYIESFDQISKKKKASNVRRFIEKPPQEMAKKFLSDKHFTWNSGIYLFKASTILSELKRYQPELFQICNKSLKESSRDLNFQRINSEIFKKCPNISIDVAVMEKTDLGTVLKLDAGWNDLGSWKSLWEDSTYDENNNSLKGKTYIKDVKNSFIRSENRLVVALGINNLFIIETDDSILVANKDSIESMKDLVNELKNNNFEEFKFNKKTYRPWGHFLNVIHGENWQVKKLEINPNESISLQKHFHRAENWIIVNGEAKVEVDDKVSFLKSNESVYVPIGSKHRLSNPGNKPLILIEVQSGSYLGEDDIIRFEDKYRRGNN